MEVKKTFDLKPPTVRQIFGKCQKNIKNSRQKTPTFPANMSSCHPASLPFPSDDVVEELPQTHCLIAWKGPDFCQTPPGSTSEEDKQMIFKTSFFLLTTPRNNHFQVLC